MLATVRDKLSSVKKGIVKGWSLPTLPDHLIKLTSHPLIRIFRVIGGISLLSIITHRYLLFPESMQLYVLFILAVINFLFLAYHFYLTYHRIRHIYLSWKSGVYDVRNSPLDRFASLAAKLIVCAKGACEVAIPITTAIGAMAIYDDYLEYKGHEPLFKPFIADMLIKDNEKMKSYTERRKLFSDLKLLDRKHNQLNDEQTAFNALTTLRENGVTMFSKEDIDTIQESFQNQSTSIQEEKNIIVNKISDNLKKSK